MLWQCSVRIVVLSDLPVVTGRSTGPSLLVGNNSHAFTLEPNPQPRRGEKKLMTVSAHELLRRFLLHVLPGGLVRIHQFWLFANRRRRAALECCRDLLGVAARVDPLGQISLRCPACSGILPVVERLTRGQLYFHPSLDSVQAKEVRR